MKLYDKYILRLQDLVETSLAITPNNKKNVLRFDNLKKQSGWLQYSIAKNIDTIHFDNYKYDDKRNSKSNLFLTEDNIVKNYFDSSTTSEKKDYSVKLHDEGQ